MERNAPFKFTGRRKPGQSSPLWSRRFVGRFAIWLLAICNWLMTAPAGEVRLKNGTTFRGKTQELQNFAPAAARPVPNNALVTRPIIMIDNGWQRTYVPLRQIPLVGYEPGVDFGQPLTFDIQQLKSGRQVTIQQVGAISEITPFDEFGRRRTTLVTPRGPLHVLQGITKITPEYTVITGLSQFWEFGVATNLVPPEVLDSVLRKSIKADNAKDRFALARFYVQAELYHKAQRELEAIAQDFPDLKAKLEADQQQLLTFRGQQAVRDLQKRKGAGQHQLAEYVGRQFLQNPDLGATVKNEIQLLLQDYDHAREAIDKANLLLGELQTKVSDPKFASRLPAMRSVIREELNFETINRLDPLLKAENDAAFTPADKLALAYSAWLVGPGDAVTDLRKTLALWDARDLMLEYLRMPAGVERELLLEKLRAVEGIGPKSIAQLIPLLPPLEETSDIQPAQPKRIVLGEEDDPQSVAYWVLLPPEYNPAHSYPAIVALRPQERTPEQIIGWWGGTAERPGPTLRRGYILLVPEYLPEKQTEYTWGSPAHRVVLESLRDARKRFSINADRVSLTGHGMGGDAAWDIGLAHPDEFASIAPINGMAENYCKFLWRNVRDLNVYVVGGELDREFIKRNQAVLDNMYVDGAHFDVVCVEYLGRGQEMYPDELPRLFDWFEKHTRARYPLKFEAKSLRAADSQLWWVKAQNLPRTYILPQRAGDHSPITAMNFNGRVTPGNAVHVETPATRHTISLSPELVDFDKRISIHLNHKQNVFRDFVQPDIKAMLDDLRSRGDRLRIVWAELNL